MKQKRAVKPTWKAEEKIGFWLSQREKVMFRFFGKLEKNEEHPVPIGLTYITKEITESLSPESQKRLLEELLELIRKALEEEKNKQ